MSKVFKKVKSFALPALGALALGPVGLGLTSAGMGGALGGALQGASKGGLGGAITGGLSGYGLGSLGSSLGNVFSGAGSTGGGFLTGGAMPTGSAIDLATGSGSNLLTAGGLPSGAAASLGALSAPLSISAGSTIPASSLSNLGASNSIGSRLGDIFGGQQGASSNADLIRNIYTGVQGTQTYKDLAKAQLQANQQAMANLSPYMATGASANERLASLLGLTGDDSEDILDSLRSTPGYQFRMEEGQSALDRNLGARGKYFSGEALKESQKFGQGLADQTYNDLLKNLASQSSQGLSAAGQGGLYSTMGGDIEANRILSESNLYNELLNRQLNPVRY